MLAACKYVRWAEQLASLPRVPTSIRSPQSVRMAGKLLTEGVKRLSQQPEFQTNRLSADRMAARLEMYRAHADKAQQAALASRQQVQAGSRCFIGYWEVGQGSAGCFCLNVGGLVSRVCSVGA